MEGMSEGIRIIARCTPDPWHRHSADDAASESRACLAVIQLNTTRTFEVDRAVPCSMLKIKAAYGRDYFGIARRSGRSTSHVRVVFDWTPA
jgi:hypothetical protein